MKETLSQLAYGVGSIPEGVPISTVLIAHIAPEQLWDATSAALERENAPAKGHVVHDTSRDDPNAEAVAAVEAAFTEVFATIADVLLLDVAKHGIIASSAPPTVLLDDMFKYQEEAKRESNAALARSIRKEQRQLGRRARLKVAMAGFAITAGALVASEQGFLVSNYPNPSLYVNSDTANSERDWYFLMAGGIVVGDITLCVGTSAALASTRKRVGEKQAQHRAQKLVARATQP